MHLWIGVENFAKIESAKICIDRYTLFVGPNNSGKTFLMQLAQGLSNKIVNLLEEDAMDILLGERVAEYSRYLLNKNNIADFVGYINRKLNLKKEQLVKEIFGKEISIDKLYLEAELEDDVSYRIDITDKKSLENEEVKKTINQDLLSLSIWNADLDDKWRIAVLSEEKAADRESRFMSLRVSISELEIYPFRRVLQKIFEEDSLYLPASRTGLMLLYRDFFANRADDAVSFQIEDGELIGNKERYGGLTQPIYEFLRFLQTYTEDEDNRNFYMNELAFFEDKIIEGHIRINKQGVFSYCVKDDNQVVPMHLASAMINEVAPLELALTSERFYRQLIIDEVEASLHPQKQLELVRFLNRLNNNGVKLIVSTHSDTFVSKLNNLYVLSELVKEKKNEEMIRHLQLEKEDLIQSENLFVYEFIFQENGKSIVKEIVPDTKTGFQFALFTKSAMGLYEEAAKLGEVQSNG